MSPTTSTRHGPLTSAQAAEVRRLADAVAERDGVEPLGEQTLLDLDDPAADHVLAEDGGLVGYGQLGPERGGVRTAELVVAPHARGAGLGRSVLDALLAAADHPGSVRLWAHDTSDAARALARDAGLTSVRELWRMARGLDGPLPAATLPGDVTLRAFVEGRDEAAWLAANAAAFAHHPEQGTLTAADLAARQAEPWFDAGDLLLAERGGALAGFVWTKVTPPLGELYVVGVVPEAQGSGLGRGLTAAALAHLRGRGVTRAVLFTDADNTPAVRTYTAAGFATDRVDTQFAAT
ncbi:mycothiol synthase [Actinotalea sp. M2MS4P-6]|uniref:mycothiol synthase n=1 Tax=Actinotalea sp. M2MS4P-6 TaxID=2983762 RepID=UPI0021E50BD0|nr:mycothiol synthase [Actinotalea sp. M2MS4P-6]MCV2394894.1 mycothiol synthase [Actinotalea sp. M2MS4P-6]